MDRSTGVTWINRHLRIVAALSWDQHLAAAKAQMRKLGGRKRRGSAEVEAGINLVVDDGLREARFG